VRYPIWLYCVVPWLHDFLVCCSRFLNNSETVPVAPIVTGITFAFTFHMCCISIVRSLYFTIFSASFLIPFLSPQIATCINIHVPFSLSRIMSGLLLGIVLSHCTCWFHNMLTLPPWLVSTDFGTFSYQCFLSNCAPVSLHMLKCSYAHTVSCLFMYCSFASIEHADIVRSIVSSNCWQSLHLQSVSVLNIFVA